jgi:mannose-1-phosphate guanylyltransferase/mannose-6-phosphate isomerase
MLEGVILAGGRGERFWPLSRRSRPKQFLKLRGERSLVQLTYDRLRRRLAPDAIRVIAGADLGGLIHADLPGLAPGRFIPETVGRSTAPAVAVAAALALRAGDPLQLVVPSDHWIPEPDDFWRSVDEALGVAAAPDSPLVTFGVPITRPETGYGYIERGNARPSSPHAYTVARFHEKPDGDRAARYQAAGDFYWNSGIFVWRASAVLAEIERHMPALHADAVRLVSAADPLALLPALFERAANESIDCGVIEKSSRVAVVEAGFAWSDLGSWDSLDALVVPDARGNVTHGDVELLETEGCVAYADEGLVAALGVRDLVIVRSGDVTLVVDRRRCQDVRRVLEALRARADTRKFL